MQESTAGTILWFAVLAAAFYMLIIRPQQKRQKEHQALMTSLAEGDRIVTIGGVFATIRAGEDDVVVAEVGDGVRSRIARSAVARKLEE
jgi:preprotein translocase subunit YajC